MGTNQSTFDRFNTWTKNSVGLKIFTIVFLILILLIPISMVENLIRERENYQENVIAEVSDKWGKHQTITAVVLTVPYYTYSTVKNEDDSEKIVKTKQLAHFLPSDLNISGNIKPEKRYRGIYEVVVYNCNLNISGHFNQPDFKKLNIDQTSIDWSQASLELGLSDLRSIQNDVHINWLDKKLNFDPGVKNNDVISSGITTTILLSDSTEQYDFDLSLTFNGSSGISFTPLGKTTKVSLNSNWSDPSFEGAFYQILEWFLTLDFLQIGKCYI